MSAGQTRPLISRNAYSKLSSQDKGCVCVCVCDRLTDWQTDWLTWRTVTLGFSVGEKLKKYHKVVHLHSCHPSSHWALQEQTTADSVAKPRPFLGVERSMQKRKEEGGAEVSFGCPRHTSFWKPSPASCQTKTCYFWEYDDLFSEPATGWP